MRRHATTLLLLSASLSLGLIATLTAVGQDATTGDSPALPSGVVIDIDSPRDTVFQMGIPSFLGSATAGDAALRVLRNDFRLMPGHTVLPAGAVDPASLADGLSIRPAAWLSQGADGVIRGDARELPDGRFAVEMRFYHVARGGSEPALVRHYEGTLAALRDHAHDFGNAVLETVTGTAGPFGTKITFSRRQGPGQKDVFCGDMDGERIHRVSQVDGISLLPSFGLGRVWFTRMTPTGMYLTHSGARDRRIIGGSGINMAPAVCDDGRVYFTSSRDGNSEIYSAAPDGTDIRRLTNDPAMDLSPACGPGGILAFVSTRHGTPQVFVMNLDGTGVRRVTFRGTHNQTPAFCPNPNRRLLAFTGRDQSYDIFTLDLATQEYVRVTQGQGDNQDPAFSPDCRVLAFSSTRRGAPGIYLSSPQGYGQTRVVEGDVESVRWGR